MIALIVLVIPFLFFGFWGGLIFWGIVWLFSGNDKG